MPLTVRAAGPVQQDGGTLFVANGCAPNGTVTWQLTGAGTLTPTRSTADAAGVATARYSATGTTAGQTITVQATSYA